MIAKYRIFKRNGVYYSEDRVSRQQTSLHTRYRADAEQLVAAKNQAAAQPVLNVAMARAYLTVSSPEMMTRTWTEVLREIEAGYTHSPSSLKRWRKFMRSDPIADLLKQPLLTTENTHLLAAMRHPKAGVSTNKFLRMTHNRALDLGWLLAPILPRKLWPKFKYRERRAITVEEHERILAAENQEDYRLLYELLWCTGGSQTDIANLGSANIEKQIGQLSFGRLKLRGRDLDPVVMFIGPNLEAVLAKLPNDGPLFPRLRQFGENIRASNFTKVCRRAGVVGVSLHCYRYSWSERAKRAGMPEREAMQQLGHNSRAVHRFYARKAGMITFPIEHYEAIRKGKIIQMDSEESPFKYPLVSRPAES